MTFGFVVLAAGLASAVPEERADTRGDDSIPPPDLSTWPSWVLPDNRPLMVVEPAASAQVHGHSTPPPDDDQWLVIDQAPPMPNEELDTVIVESPLWARVLTWPFDVGVLPVVEAVKHQAREPIHYVESTAVVERTLDLLSPTPGEGTWVNPKLSLEGPSASIVGFSVVSADLPHGMAATLNAHLSMGGDHRVRTHWRINGPGSTRLVVEGRWSEDVATPVWLPGRLSEPGRRIPPGNLHEERKSLRLIPTIGTPRAGTFMPTFERIRLNLNEPRRPSLSFPDPLPWSGNARAILRGSFDLTLWGLDWRHSTIDRRGISTSGRQLDLSVRRWSMDPVNENGWSVSGRAHGFHLIGDEAYVYRRADIEPWLNLSPTEIVRMLDPRTLRQRLTQRRILAWQVKVAQLVADADAPLAVHPSIGGNAPARAYGGRRLLGRFLAGGTIEYRLPIWTYLDGTAFWELAAAAPSASRLAPWRLAPGMGVGVRARTREMFLGRAQVAWGRDGPVLLLTLQPEF